MGPSASQTAWQSWGPQPACSAPSCLTHVTWANRCAHRAAIPFSSVFAKRTQEHVGAVCHLMSRRRCAVSASATSQEGKLAQPLGTQRAMRWETQDVVLLYPLPWPMHVHTEKWLTWIFIRHTLAVLENQNAKVLNLEPVSLFLPVAAWVTLNKSTNFSRLHS